MNFPKSFHLSTFSEECKKSHVVNVECTWRHLWYETYCLDVEDNFKLPKNHFSALFLPSRWHFDYLEMAQYGKTLTGCSYTKQFAPKMVATPIAWKWEQHCYRFISLNLKTQLKNLYINSKRRCFRCHAVQCKWSLILFFFSFASMISVSKI